MTETNFEKRIKQEMTRLDIEQGDLASALGKTQPTISTMIKNENPSIKLKDYQTLHEMGFDVDFLITGKKGKEYSILADNPSDVLTQKVYTLQGKYIKCLEEKEALREQISLGEKEKN